MKTLICKVNKQKNILLHKIFFQNPAPKLEDKIFHGFISIFALRTRAVTLWTSAQTTKELLNIEMFNIHSTR